jgi:sugar/nucleoside kinase (ribokinase family)
MKQSVSVVGAAAIGDYIFRLDKLPEKGEIVPLNWFSMDLEPGGCAPNIAAGLAAHGIVDPMLFYPVGSDFAQSKILERWLAAGINCSRITRVKDVPSGRAWVFMQNDGSTMCFAYAGAADVAVPSDIGYISDIIVIAPVLNHFTKTYLTKAIEENKTIVVTGIGNEKILPYISDIDVLIVNEYEAGQLCKLLDFKSPLNILQKHPNLRLYVTRGAHGSIVYLRDDRIEIPIVKEEIRVDSTGAGDAYCSGIVSAMVLGKDAVEAAYFGSANASFVIENVGGQTNLPTWKHLEDRLKNQFGYQYNKGE